MLWQREVWLQIKVSKDLIHQVALVSFHLEPETIETSKVIGKRLPLRELQQFVQLTSIQSGQTYMSVAPTIPLHHPNLLNSTNWHPRTINNKVWQLKGKPLSQVVACINTSRTVKGYQIIKLIKDQPRDFWQDLNQKGSSFRTKSVLQRHFKQGIVTIQEILSLWDL